MAEFWYVASTGRCGTQFLARLLNNLGGDAVVLHERHGDDHSPRTVLRNPEARFAQLGRKVKLQQLYIKAENQIRKGNRFVSCDWHAFSWIDYFADRFGPAFRFVHLVRNPYDVAASHATHTPMDPSKNLRHEAACRVFATDPNLAHPEFAAMADGFNIYERHLFHWLEVTSFILGNSDHDAFQGLYRFEEVMAPDRKVLTGLVSRIMGREVIVPEAAPFDRVHRASPWPLDFHVASELRAAVDAVAGRVGYAQTELDAACDPERLQSIYSAPRFDLPCDPKLPVIGRKGDR